MTEKRRILVVDDDELMRWMLADALSEQFDVIEAASGEEALAVAQREAPDAILLDVEMPGIGGVETCRRLKAIDATATIPVLFVSGYDLGAERRVGEQVGNHDYLVKPFSPSEVQDKVGSVLGMYTT